MPKFLKKLLKILAILSVVCIAFLGFVYVKYSNFDGYCEEAGKILTEEELIRKVVRKDIYEDNPYCCAVISARWLKSDINNFLDNLFGYYNYQLDIYSKRPLPLTHNKNDPYDESHTIIDACGNTYNSYGMSISEKEYRNSTIDIKISRTEKK